MDKGLRFAVLAGAMAVAACGADRPELVVPPAKEAGVVVPEAEPRGTGGSSVIVIPDASSTTDSATPDSSSCGSLGCPETGPRCGNGLREDTEQCDDGNTAPGDGCDGNCRTEPNYDCPAGGGKCVSTVVCGDSLITGNEACDDGNIAGGDGCSAVCQVEQGFQCAGAAPSVCTPVVMARCGDGAVNAGEQCDDGGRADNDGCSASCQLEPGWHCPQPGQPCVLDAYCGDGRLNGNDVCDDGNSNPGDGCNGRCMVEPNFACPTPGQPCVSTIVCGDGRVTGDEACDDGNTADNDGCAADCKHVEPGFRCPTTAGVGGPCMSVPANTCGDAILSFGEFCDDGNTMDGDGCSHLCQVEPGYNCPTVGRLCTLIAVCGDGRITPPEECDDGNPVAGDGCNSTCRIEPNFTCPAAGAACQTTVRCGDRIVTGDETCDDGNTLPNDGCSPTCRVEPGWQCPVPGAACIARLCGDGILALGEQCDDGNTVSGDGCSACRLDSAPNGDSRGWQCLTPGQPCTRTVCGNGIREGSETCDDGNTRSLDGCAWNCAIEPTCGYGNAQDGGVGGADGGSAGAYACHAVCGDGMVFPGEGCDDGNTVSGDGCSATCTVEPGYSCLASPPPLPDTLFLPIEYRDFAAIGTSQHPQFEVSPRSSSDPNATDFDRRQPGIALSAIGANGKPQFNPAYVGTGLTGIRAGVVWTMDGPAQDTGGTNITDVNSNTVYHTRSAGNAPSLNATQIAQRYAQWYVDTAGVNLPFQEILAIGQLVPGTYQYDRSRSNPANNQFFPIDNRGFGNLTTDTITHNFHFTSEVRYWFAFGGGEQLEFRGDDDVWVFVNGQLTVDLGGIHSELRGVVTLNTANLQVCTDDTPCVPSMTDDCNGAIPNCVTRAHNLVLGNIYEIAVFQAERHITESNYKLTLRGFNAPKSVCTPVCGNNVVTGTEACDFGSANTDSGAYGTCTTHCAFGPRCGDGVRQFPPEDCDDGVNAATAYSPTRQCGPTCHWNRYCGDGQTTDTEQCDDGTNNNTGGYGRCTADCKLGPRCGDGVPSDGEQCDDGPNNGNTTSACRADCRLKCGDGTIDPGEQCDEGAAVDGGTNNTGAYGHCNANCTLGPRCGDGIRNGTEQCDDGRNDGSYGTCGVNCVLGPRCGDGAVQATAGEICDQGPNNNANAYGRDLCLTSCKPAPFCGDREVDASHGEVCDDGVNSGQPGSCTMDCKGFVPLPSCGDGIRQPPEQCDNGQANNGQPGNVCDVHCRLTCGNGFRDPGEGCDDGVNDGSYGTCNPNCTPAPYCGDNVKNGPEQCDQGPNNLPNPYGSPDQCTTMCTIAPYCGDGRIQTEFGEECDGAAGCDPTCHLRIIR